MPVIANALNDLPASFEQLAATQSNVGRMRAAGVKVALGMINDDEARQVRLARQHAGNLVAHRPAARRIGPELGRGACDDHLGAGRGARDGRRDRLAAAPAGAPTSSSGTAIRSRTASAAEMVLIDGVQQPLDNHQTKLRDRYRTPDRRAICPRPTTR